MTVEAPPSLPPKLVIPSECALLPVAPPSVDVVALPPLPAVTAPDYLAIRTKRAELAGLFYQGMSDAEKTARETNAATQEKCAAWAKGNGG